MPDALSLVRDHLTATAQVLQLTAARCAGDIARAVALLAHCFRSGGRLYLCGNGGSAAECQHLAAEFVHRLSRHHDRAALPAVALTADAALLTAVANDSGFERIFARQLEALGRAGDVVLALTTSGRSRNLHGALEAARRLGLATIVLAGEERTPLHELADLALHVPAADPQAIQEVHLVVGHAICAQVERELFAPLPGT